MNITMRASALALVLGGLLCIGCGGGNSVSGVVTLDGQPVPGAQVTLTPKDGANQTSHSGTTTDKGSFVISGDGDRPIEPGEYVVVVDKVASEMGAESPIPAQYRDSKTSPLTATVGAGSTSLPEMQLESQSAN